MIDKRGSSMQILWCYAAHRSERNSHYSTSFVLSTYEFRALETTGQNKHHRKFVYPFTSLSDEKFLKFLVLLILFILSVLSCFEFCINNNNEPG